MTLLNKFYIFGGSEINWYWVKSCQNLKVTSTLSAREKCLQIRSQLKWTQTLQMFIQGLLEMSCNKVYTNKEPICFK